MRDPDRFDLRRSRAIGRSRDGHIDWSRVVVDSCSVSAVFGGGRLDRFRRIELNLEASAT